MASKRSLKKKIQYICGDIAGETIIAANYVDGFNREAANKIVNEIAALQSETVAKISFAFDKAPRDFENRAEYNKARHAYNRAAFASLRSDFGKHVNEIVKEMNQAMPAEAREALKKK